MFYLIYKRVAKINVILAVLLTLLPLVVFSKIFKGDILIPGCSLYNEYYPWKDTDDVSVKNYCAGKTFWGPDPLLFMYPLKTISIENLKKGIIPLWNPYVFNGTPLLANNQSAVFYPFNLLYFIFDFNFAWSLVTILQPMGAGLFMYLYLRRLKISSVSSFWGGMIFSWSGVMTGYFHHQVIGHTVLWVPLILYLYEGIGEVARAKSLLLLTIAFTCLLTAGHFQFALYSLMLVALVIVFGRNLSKKVWLIISAFFLGLGISSVQMLPTLEYITKSVRDANVLYGKYFLLLPQQLWRFLSPGMFGDPTLGNWWGNFGIVREHQYVGLLGLIFAFCGIVIVLFVRKTSQERLWKWVLLTILILVFSIKSPLTEFVYSWQIPLWSTVTPSRLIEMVVVPLAILSAYGVEYCVVKGRFRPILISVFVCTGILLFIPWNLNSGLGSMVGETIARSFEKEGKVFLLSAPFVFLLAFFYTRKKLSFLVVFVLVAIHSTDLINENLFFTNHFIKGEYLYQQNPLSKYLVENIGNQRFVSFDTALFSLMSFVPDRLNSPSGYDPLILKLYVDFYKEHLKNDPISKEYDNRAIRFTNMSQNIRDMLGIKYVLTRQEQSDENIDLVDEIGGSYVYESKTVLPLFYLTSFKQILVKNDAEALSIIFDKNIRFNPRKEILLSQAVDQESGSAEVSAVRLLSDTINSFLLETASSQSQILLISETYDIGWKVKIDGLDSKIFRANYLEMAIRIPKGKHTIKLYYLPTSFRIGLVFSGISLILLLSVFVSDFLKRKARG